MTCKFSTPLTKTVNQCALDLYGGRPSVGTCTKCISCGENNCAHAAQVKATYDKAFPPDKRGTLKECGC